MIRIGRLVLDESEIRNIEESPGSISLDGIETVANQSVASVHRKHQDVIRSLGLMVPVIFDHKPDWDGYYEVTSSGANLTNWHSQEVAACDWKFDLGLIGSHNDIDLESRLGGPLTLANPHSGVGERWHAPPVGHTAYWSGAAQPSSAMDRVGEEGTLKVYRGVALNTNVRWSCRPNLYPIGRTRFTDHNGFERVGSDGKLEVVGWKISNSLVRLGALAGDDNLQLEVYSNGAWRSQTWQVRYDGASLGTPRSVSIIRNDYEVVQVRLLWNVTPSGRATADLTLRRGARHVEIYMKSMLGATLAIRPTLTIASTNSTGYLTATADDANGNRYTSGSATAYTADTTNGGLSRAAVQVLDAYVGFVVGGGSAVAGDTAANIFAQFLGAPTERVLGVRL